MERKTATAGKHWARPHRRVAQVSQVLALLAWAGVMALTASSAKWSASLFVIAAFTIVSDLTSVDTGSTKVKVSGSFLGIVLAAVLLGGPPASLLAIASVSIGWLHRREPTHYLINNVVNYAWFPLASGLFFHAASAGLHLGPHVLGYYLLLCTTFPLALSLNFLGAAGYQSFLDGSSLLHKAREILLPVLSAELFSALLTMAAVYVAVQLGATGLALFGVVLVIFQYLVGELLKSKQRGEQLHRVATTDELTGLPNRERFRARLHERIARPRPRAGSRSA